jgi:hypothetical protein
MWKQFERPLAVAGFALISLLTRFGDDAIQP